MRKHSIYLKALTVIALAVTMLAASLAMPLTYRAFADETDSIDAGMDLSQISKFGNVMLVKDGRVLTENDFNDAGIEYGDIVTVSFLDKELEMPVVHDYSEVDTGVLLLRVDDSESQIAVNMGDFASEYIADKSTFEDQSFAWTYKKGISDVTFRIALKTKGGLKVEYGSNQLLYSDERSDYPDLSDEEFANFRVVATTGMGKDTLYRSATPVDPQRNRNTYADAACKKHGIATVMNMADSEDKVKAFPGYDETYYSTTDYIALDMSLDFDSDEFREKMAKGLRYFIDHEGPYMVHCTEGKDRAGMASALLECLMGATYDEVVSDYMVSYYNYYGITPDDDRYDRIVSRNIETTLRKMYKVDDLTKADLAAEAEEYCRELGLTDDEIKALKVNLAGAKEAETDYVSVAVFVGFFALGLLIAGIIMRKKRSRKS